MTLARLLLPAALVLWPGSQDIVDVPTVEHAIPDTPVPDQIRPVLDIHYDGRIFRDDQLLYDPEVDDLREDPFRKLYETLAVTAKRMRQKHIDEESGAGPRIPDEPILLRPDRSAPFRYVQRCMETCGRMGVQIWKVQLAGRTTEGAGGRLDAYLPKDIGVSPVVAEPIEKVEVLIKVSAEGTKLQPGSDGEVATADSGRFVYGEDRELLYSVGPFRTKDLGDLRKRLVKLHTQLQIEDEGNVPITIDARVGTIYQDVTEVLDVILGAGFTDVHFVGYYE